MDVTSSDRMVVESRLTSEEPMWVVDEIIRLTGSSARFVQEAVEDIRHIVDRLLTDDYSIIAPPLIMRRSQDPVYRAVMDRLKNPLWDVPTDLDLMNEEELARQLSLDAEVVAQYPVAWTITILVGVVDWRELDTSDPQARELADVLEAWLDTYRFVPSDRGVRRYRPRRVGLEKDFERWLVANLHVLRAFDYPVDICQTASRADFWVQWRCRHGRVADMVAHVSADGGALRAGDWLIIENKATMVGPEALDQIQHYISCARSELARDGETVFGLLLADGITVDLQKALAAAGVGYLSLAALGYRDHLYRTQRHPVVVDGDDLNRILHTIPEPATEPMTRLKRQRPLRLRT